LSQIYHLDPTIDARWSAFVERHPRGSVFHSPGWLRALQTTYGYQPILFTTDPPSEPINCGLVFCRVESWLTGSRLVSLPFSDHCGFLYDSTADLACLCHFLQEEVGRQIAEYVQVRPLCPDPGPTNWKNAWSPSEEYFLHRLDMRPDLSDLFESFDKDSVRRRIRRAERTGLIEKCGRTSQLLHDFYKLFVITRRRHGIPPTPFRWFQTLAQELREALDIRVAYKDEEPVASIITLRFKKTVYYKYGASDTQFNAYGATPWLFWQAIQAGKSSGATQFDFGRTELGNSGLLAFKNHWVACPTRLVYWQYPASSRGALTNGWKWRAAKRLFSALPSRLQVVGGDLIYRHIG